MESVEGQELDMWDIDEENFFEDDFPSSIPPPTEPIAEHQYTIGDLTVKFPYPAYESQLQMMESAINAVNSSQHALLESPTGTGKTAALLCSLLAWLEKVIISEGRAQFQSETLPLEDNGARPSTSLNRTSSTSVNDVDESVGNDFTLSDTPVAPTAEVTIHLRGRRNLESDRPAKKPTRIFYATRTHSQIKQVVSQLKNTHYATVAQTVVLASRNQLCVNSDALCSESVDEACTVLIENEAWNEKHEDKDKEKYTPKPTCPFHDKQASFHYGGFDEPMDVEELREYAKSCGSCAYFGTKVMRRSARVIFCTYNHLLHSGIRKAMDISVQGNILVFDEAHNIENICREMATLHLTLQKVENVKTHLAAIRQPREKGGKDIPVSKIPYLQKLEVSCIRLNNWLRQQWDSNNPEFKLVSSDRLAGTETSKRVLENPVDEFSAIGFGPEDVKKLYRDCLIPLERKEPTSDETFALDPKVKRALNSLLFCFNMLYRKDKMTGELYRLKDYRVMIIKKGQTGTKKSKPDIPDIELCLLCLNPAVTFEKMREARTVIVTSGTLSPTASFSSELETEFAHILSAKHVLGPDRVFSAVISKFSNESPGTLQFNQRSLNQDFTFHQSDLGQIILAISRFIPHGILVFAPSSDLMRRLKQNWEAAGMLTELRKLKKVFFEHEVRHPSEFAAMLKAYSKYIEDGHGAILFAILRGRVSEGIDFADKLARAVVTIGIPYLPFKDESVEAKMAYNDAKSKENSDYLDGWQWYDINAYRALNQALGRSVRHKDDWGADFIVDGRFFPGSKHRKNLPRWIEASLVTWTSQSERSLLAALPNLQKFLSGVHQHREDDDELERSPESQPEFDQCLSKCA